MPIKSQKTLKSLYTYEIARKHANSPLNKTWKIKEPRKSLKIYI